MTNTATPCNIAIVVCISQYDTLDALPGCSADADKMHDLLKATGKYDSISVLRNERASKAKEQIREVVETYKSRDVNEAFFYFSGHGTFESEATGLLLCCSDYTGSRRLSTSLQNSDIDELLRNLKPRFAVKILDACNSGVHYIKSSKGLLEKSLSTSPFELLWFMASSETYQSSYASPDGSDFTLAFIEAATNSDIESIRYRDMQAYIADRFVGSPQTPIFVTQCTGLEEFTTRTDAIKRLSHTTSGPKTALAPLGTSKPGGKYDIISTFDALHKTEAEVLDATRRAQEHLTSPKLLSHYPGLAEHFTHSSDFSQSLESLPRASLIAKWVTDKGLESSIFAKVRSETRKRKLSDAEIAQKSLYSGLSLESRLLGTKSHDQYETFTAITGISTTHALPFEAAKIYFTSTHPSLSGLAALVGLLHSTTELYVFTSVTRMKRAAWSDFQIDESRVQWSHQLFLWRDIVKDPTLLATGLLKQAAKEFETEVTEMQAKLSEPPPASGTRKP